MRVGAEAVKSINSPAPVCVYVCVSLQRAGQRKKCASCHIVIHTGCMARLDQVNTTAAAAAAAADTDACD